MSEEFKLSQFNVATKIPGTSTVILYNSASGSIAKISETVYNNLNNGLLKGDELDLCIKNGFLIPSEKDELAELEKLRLQAIIGDGNTARFTIAPTLACNARCFYCFEPKNQICSMTPDVADATVDFIRKQSKGKDIGIHWFGGEPLLMSTAIEKITKEIKSTIGNRKYFASIATNGSLFTDEFISKLKDLSIDFVQITIDGTEEEYTKRKNYSDKNTNYYRLVMENIEKLLKAGAYVKVRINIDKQNIQSAIDLIHELTSRFKNRYDRFSAYVFPLSGSSGDERLFKANELKKPLSLLYAELFKAGYISTYDDLHLNPRKIHCGARKPNSFNIDPRGDLFKCEHLIGRRSERVGNVFEGVTQKDKYAMWVSAAIPEKCVKCSWLPVCQGGCSVNSNSNLGDCLPVMSMLNELLVLAYGIHLKGGAGNERCNLQSSKPNSDGCYVPDSDIHA